MGGRRAKTHACGVGGVECLLAVPLDGNGEGGLTEPSGLRQGLEAGAAQDGVGRVHQTQEKAGVQRMHDDPGRGLLVGGCSGPMTEDVGAEASALAQGIEERGQVAGVEEVGEQVAVVGPAVHGEDLVSKQRGCDDACLPDAAWVGVVVGQGMPGVRSSGECNVLEEAPVDGRGSGGSGILRMPEHELVPDREDGHGAPWRAGVPLLVWVFYMPIIMEDCGDYLFIDLLQQVEDFLWDLKKLKK